MDHAGLGLDAVVQYHAGGHLDDLLLGGAGIDGDAVELAYPAGRVGQQVDEGAVIGHQQQALAVLIQAAHRAQHGRNIGDKVHNGLAAAVIGPGGQKAAWFVQHDIGILPLAHDADGLAVDSDLIVIGVHLVTQAYRVTVNFYFAGGDQALRLTAGADTLIGQHFLNALFCHAYSLFLVLMRCPFQRACLF